MASNGPSPKRKNTRGSGARALETTFNTYELVSVKGEGGAGYVWAATDTGGNSVAVKILKLSGATTERRKRFQNEVTFCQNAKHPNIVCVLDHGLAVDEQGRVPFFVMPLYAYSFRTILSEKPDFQKRLRYFDQMLSGVESAHLRGVIHRDLKPENILYDPAADRVVVADFGIAHFLDEELYTAVETSAHARLANFIYAAPEQRARGGRVDPRTDIYSLGLMLNEMFTNEVPHGVAYKTVGDVSAAYGWVDEVVAQMIQNDPARRPQTCDQVKALLIARNQDYVERQRLSEIQKRVIPVGEEDDPLALEPPRVTAVDWKDGTLTLILDRVVNDGWVQALRRMGNYTSVMGVGPETFSFSGKRAQVRVEDYSAQQVIDYFKQWLPNATRAYANARARKRSDAAEQERKRLQAERDALEKNQRVRTSLRI